MVRDSISVRISRGMMVVVLALFLLQGFNNGTFAQETGKSPNALEKAFPSSSKCKRCHERVFEEWETSPLARSIHSPAFRASLDTFLASPAGKDRAQCFRCHA